MKTKAAVLSEFGKPWTIEEVDVDPPAAGEVLVAWEASGLCHSDEHLRLGDFGGPLPEVAMIGGHEGAGRILEVGPGVRDLKEGDHVVASFLPACGRCRFCATGHSNLCDLGAYLMTGTQPDGTFRRRWNGIEEATLARTLAKTLAASLVMGLVVALVNAGFAAAGLTGRGFVFTVVELAISVGAGALAFAATAFVLRMDELRTILDMLLRRRSPNEAEILA